MTFATCYKLVRETALYLQDTHIKKRYYWIILTLLCSDVPQPFSFITYESFLCSRFPLAVSILGLFFWFLKKNIEDTLSDFQK